MQIRHHGKDAGGIDLNSAELIEIKRDIVAPSDYHHSWRCGLPTCRRLRRLALVSTTGALFGHLTDAKIHGLPTAIKFPESSASNPRSGWNIGSPQRQLWVSSPTQFTKPRRGDIK